MHVAHNFKWESDTHFRVVNKEGFEKYVCIQSGEWIIKDSTFVPMKDIIHKDKSSQYYFDNLGNSSHKSMNRLLTRYQKIFTNKQLALYSKRVESDAQYVLSANNNKFFISHLNTPLSYKLTKALKKD